MKTYIVNHFTCNDDFVYETIINHKEWYGENNAKDLMGGSFMDLIDEKCDLIGFFATYYHQCDGFNACVLAFVFIKEEYRNKGFLKKIVKYVKQHNTEYELIVVGARYENKLANDIYSHLFEFYESNDEDGGNWYKIVDRRE